MSGSFKRAETATIADADERRPSLSSWRPSIYTELPAGFMSARVAHVGRRWGDEIARGWRGTAGPEDQLLRAKAAAGRLALIRAAGS